MNQKGFAAIPVILVLLAVITAVGSYLEVVKIFGVSSIPTTQQPSQLSPSAIPPGFQSIHQVESEQHTLYEQRAKSFCEGVDFEYFKKVLGDHSFPETGSFKLTLINSFAINFDSDSNNEVLGLCVGDDKDKSDDLMMFVLDDQETSFSLVFSRAGVKGQRFLPMDNLGFGDLDGDGIDEIIYSSAAWSTFDSSEMTHLYAPKYREDFWRNDWVQRNTDTNNQPSIKRGVTFSDNVGKYRLIQEFLANTTAPTLYWPTYTNKNYHFVFRYAPTWRITKSLENEVEITRSDSSFLAVQVSNDDPEELLKSAADINSVIPFQFGEISAKLFSIGSGTSNRNTLVFKFGNNFYSITGSSPDFHPETFDTFFSTFKFTK